MIKSKELFLFFNLLDIEGRLSITNLAVIICLLKLVFSPSASITEAGTLLVALANYAHKRSVAKTQAEAVTPQVEAFKAQLSEIESKVSALNLQSGLKNGLK